MNPSAPSAASAPPATPEGQASGAESFFLDSLRAETAALRVVVLAILREVDDERRESIKEVLNYALSVARERRQGDTAYMRSLEEKLQQMSKLLSIGSSEGSEDSPRG